VNRTSTEEQTSQLRESHPIRVMHVIDSLAPGGAERMLVELVNISLDTDILPSVCVTRNDLTLSNKIKHDIPVHCLHRNRTFEISKIKAFKQLARENDVQIFHTHGYSSFRFTFIACLLGKISGKIILHAHSSSEPDPLTILLGRSGIDYYLGTSKETCEWASSKFHLPPARIRLMTNAINPAPYRNASPIKLDLDEIKGQKKIGLVIANIRLEKDLLTLIKAVSIAKSRHDLILLIAGLNADDKYYKKCINEINNLGLSEQFRFLGSRDDIPSLIKVIDFGLLSSRRETGPVALIEYLAGDIPFIVTNTGQIARMVHDAGIPDCVPVGDFQAYAEAIDLLVTLPENERLHRIEKGRIFFKQQLDITYNSDELIRVYRQVISE